MVQFTKQYTVLTQMTIKIKLTHNVSYAPYLWLSKTSHMQQKPHPATAHTMSEQGGNTESTTEISGRPLDALADIEDTQSSWKSETSTAASSSSEDRENSTAPTSSHPSPAPGEKHTCSSSEQRHLPSSPNLTPPPVAENADEWDGSTLDGHSQSDTEPTLVDEIQSIPSPDEPEIINPANIPLPAEFPDETEKPEPSCYEGKGLVKPTTRCDAASLQARLVGKSAKRRLDMKVKVLQQEAESDLEGGRADSVVRWDTETAVDMFGIIRPVGIGRV